MPTFSGTKLQKKKGFTHDTYTYTATTAV